MCCLSLCHGDGTFLARCYLALDQTTPLDHVTLPLINETDTIIGLLNCEFTDFYRYDVNRCKIVEFTARSGVC